MLSRTACLLAFIAFSVIVWLGTNVASAQNSGGDFHNILREKAAFDETDFAELGQSQAVVRLLPVTDKREVAVCGLIRLQAWAEVFLQFLRESLTSKGNPAILEIGRFSDTPTSNNLHALTIEDRDLEDLKECFGGQ
jgi:hypothetical protein